MDKAGSQPTHAQGPAREQRREAPQAPGFSGPHAGLLALQQMAGNRAVSGLVRSSAGAQSAAVGVEEKEDETSPAEIETPGPADAIEEDEPEANAPAADGPGPAGEVEEDEPEANAPAADGPGPAGEVEEPETNAPTADAQATGGRGRPASVPKQIHARRQSQNISWEREARLGTTFWGKAEQEGPPSAASWGISAQESTSGEPRGVSRAEMEGLPTLKSSAGSATSGPPLASTLGVVQGHAGSLTTHGWTFFPTGYKAPDFVFGSYSVAGGKKGALAQWYAKPKLVQKAYEGRGDAFYTRPGTYDTKMVEASMKVYWKFNSAISNHIRIAEQEHCDDHKFAYKISLKEAEIVLRRHIVGKKFGPKLTQAAVEQVVLNRIKAVLIHPQLGNDKTKWAAKYDMLFRKTDTRDMSGWHTLPPANRKVIGKKVYYKIVKGKSKIGVVKSPAIIKY
jgi:hypothetical protein